MKKKHDDKILHKWYKTIDETMGGEVLKKKTKNGEDRLDKDVLENEDGDMICLPIRYEGKATKGMYDNDIEVRERKQKEPSLILRFTRWAKYSGKEIQKSDALDGKKVRIAIEVMD